MALLQGIKKLFGPLLDDLDCVNAIKEAIELQVEACHQPPSSPSPWMCQAVNGSENLPSVSRWDQGPGHSPRCVTQDTHPIYL